MTTLYVTSPGSFLQVKSSHFQLFEQQQLCQEIPIKQVSQIILFSYCDLSRRAVNLALSHRIPVAFLADQGHYIGRVDADVQRQRQYKTRQQECSLHLEFTQSIAESLIRAKLYNSRTLLLRLNRRTSTSSAQKAINALTQLIEHLPMVNTLDALWNYETKAATLYYRALGSLLPNSFNFQQRTFRPPIDRINSLLNLGYALLSQNLYIFVQELGLDTDLGNLHTSCQNHTPLVCDLMEQFRAPIVEDLVADLVNRECLSLDDFLPPDEQGGMYLSPNVLHKFLKHWEEKLQTPVTHLSVVNVTYRHCLELQVREYLSFLIGEQEFYRPLLWKE